MRTAVFSATCKLNMSKTEYQLCTCLKAKTASWIDCVPIMHLTSYCLQLSTVQRPIPQQGPRLVRQLQCCSALAPPRIWRGVSMRTRSADKGGLAHGAARSLPRLPKPRRVLLVPVGELGRQRRRPPLRPCPHCDGGRMVKRDPPIVENGAKWRVVFDRIGHRGRGSSRSRGRGQAAWLCGPGWG